MPASSSQKSRCVVCRVGPGSSERWYPGFTRYNAACAWALLGDKEHAITSLEAAVSSGFTFNRQVIAADPDFASIKEDPRFRRIVEAQ